MFKKIIYGYGNKFQLIRTQFSVHRQTDHFITQHNTCFKCRYIKPAACCIRGMHMDGNRIIHLVWYFMFIQIFAKCIAFSVFNPESILMENMRGILCAYRNLQFRIGSKGGIISGGGFLPCSIVFAEVAKFYS